MYFSLVTFELLEKKIAKGMLTQIDMLVRIIL